MSGEGQRCIPPGEDPVCGMAVDVSQAARDSLVLRHRDLEFSFCSRGCLLEFGDDPAWFLDAAYAPTML